uniref:tyrosine-type recombinase/integrase n=2 Tax=Algoriphagus sp. TaxID=1872435 RepID=UPI00404762E0
MRWINLENNRLAVWFVGRKRYPKVCAIKPFNESYFSNLWKKFKRKHRVEKGITLYSFRHTAAIDIYTRTGSLSKLQKAMGHSNIMVSLTYLRGLDVAELKEEDMPMI